MAKVPMSEHMGFGLRRLNTWCSKRRVQSSMLSVGLRAAARAALASGANLPAPGHARRVRGFRSSRANAGAHTVEQRIGGRRGCARPRRSTRAMGRHRWTQSRTPCPDLSSEHGTNGRGVHPPDGGGTDHSWLPVPCWWAEPRCWAKGMAGLGLGVPRGRAGLRRWAEGIGRLESGVPGQCARFGSIMRRSGRTCP